jgi:general secretion pathway protein A
MRSEEESFTDPSLKIKCFCGIFFHKFEVFSSPSLRALLMYCEYYDFSEKPFTVTPNPRFIFLSKNHQEAFAHLLYGIDNHAGFIELTGEVGTGKTTVLRTLLGQLDEKNYRTALIFNPCLSATELLRGINREFGIPSEGLSDAALLRELNRFLVEEKSAGRTVSLVIDEAQNLEPSVLEQIRLISNLETDTDKLIQIVLAGQPELGRLLEKPELRQLAQRITVRFHLRPMDYDDTRAYIRHRLNVAGCGLSVQFAPAALKRVFRYSGGIPRLINILCDRSLLVGYGEEQRNITRSLVNSAIGEIRRERCRRKPGLWKWAVVAGFAAVVLPCFFYILYQKAGVWPLHIKGWFDNGVVSADPDSTANQDGVGKSLAVLGEKESFLKSFNTLAKLWGAGTVREFRGKDPASEMDELARRRGMRVILLKGDMKTLASADTPALLEFRLPGRAGRRFLALTGLEGDRLIIEPSLSGRSSFSFDDLKIFWSGRAYILWKNIHGIPLLAVSGDKGPQIALLQKMLVKAGFYKGMQSGVYDKATTDAVRSFQRAKGLVPDGKVGEKTLFFLYRDGERLEVPRLVRKKGEHKV